MTSADGFAAVYGGVEKPGGEEILGFLVLSRDSKSLTQAKNDRVVFNEKIPNH